MLNNVDTLYSYNLSMIVFIKILSLLSVELISETVMIKRKIMYKPLRLQTISFQVSVDLVDALEILLSRDQVVQIPHLCLFLVGLVGFTQPPHLGPLAHLEIFKFAVNQLLQLIWTFILNLADIEKVPRKALIVHFGFFCLQLQHILFEHFMWTICDKSWQIREPLVDDHTSGTILQNTLYLLRLFFLFSRLKSCRYDLRGYLGAPR